MARIMPMARAIGGEIHGNAAAATAHRAMGMTRGLKGSAGLAGEVDDAGLGGIGAKCNEGSATARAAGEDYFLACQAKLTTLL